MDCGFLSICQDMCLLLKTSHLIVQNMEKFGSPQKAISLVGHANNARKCSLCVLPKEKLIISIVLLQYLGDTRMTSLQGKFTRGIVSQVLRE